MYHYVYDSLYLKNSLFSAGFINLGTSQNRQIANFQYVAPLLAYFDPSLDDSSSVHHLDSGRGFVCDLVRNISYKLLGCGALEKAN